MEKLLAYRQTIAQKIKELEDELKEINEEILHKYNENGKYEVGDWTLTVSDTKRFDKNLAKQVLSPQQIQVVSDYEVNGSKLKALYPEDYEFCQKVYGKRLIVKETN